MTEQQTGFNYLLRVRYGECDGQLVVFNARYADYVDVAVTEYFRYLFGGFQALLEQGYDNQVVNLNINWFASAKFDDVLNVQVKPRHLGNTSFTLSLAFTNASNERAIAEADITYVMVDSNNYQKTTPPEWFKQHLQNPSDTFVKVDHAAYQASEL